ncbi:hypothetical protein [Janthinobacterium agaricidamnosum]|uniref:hypothetical protein n=1 Tax=Janthinobacterium agaricidamnosum TaxID=55508 RepID=UPI000A795D69|nr:hypothetical protein [Janthinobacterium agaricidamnosum]
MSEQSIVTVPAAKFEFLSIVDLPALKAHLKQTLTGPTILGSQLGELLLRASPVIERQIVVRQFGGLRKFARDHLSDMVVLKAQHAVGQAEIYEVLVGSSELGEPASAREPLSFTPRNARFFWYAISNPLSRYATAIVANKLVCHVKNEPVDGAVSFLPFSLENYREVAREFVASLPSPVNNMAETLLTETKPEELHRKLIPFLRTECGGAEVQRWDGIRRSEILKKFVEQALAHGLDAIEVEDYRLMLSKVNSKPEALTVIKNETKLVDQKKSEGLTNIQFIAIDVIRRMSDEQIRALDLPFGLVLDAATTKLT